MKKFIPVNEPLLDGNEKRYLSECIDSGWISSEGPFVKKFEDEFSSKVGRKYGVAVANGTAALDIAIDALGIGQGDEVILPAFTIISCVHQIIRSGAKPVIVDSDPLTWNINVKDIASRINNRTKAILVVHIYGLPVDLDPIINLCNERQIFLIEDAAEMIGQKYKGRYCGSFGDISTVSFYPNKHITTGEGGMVLTNNKLLAEKAASLRNLCFKPENRFVHERIGWNYRMTNLQAALGVAQLERLDEFIEKKRRIGDLYNSLLSELKNITLPVRKTDYAENIYWVYGVVLGEEIDTNAHEIINILGRHGIGARPFFCPLNRQPVLRKLGLFKNENYPVAENLFKKGFYLPSGLALNESDIIYASKTLTSLLKKIQ